jgi:hypothetical protein
MSIPILNQIKQSEARLAELRATLDTEQASVSAASRKYEGNLGRRKPDDSAGAHLAMRMKALKGRYEAFITEQDKHLELQNRAIHDQLEKQHGLLAYALATGDLSPEMQLLHGSLADFLNAKNDADRKAAKRSIDLCWTHSTLPEVGKKVDTAILDEFESIEDPEERSRFYREHTATIASQLQARQDSNQP